MTEEQRYKASPPLSVASIILSMIFLAIGNGLMFAYIPVRLAAEGYAPWVAGMMITAMSAGGIAGCLFSGPLIQRAGHARVFAALAALVIMSAALIALFPHPAIWTVSRGIYGFAVAGIFVVSQSWLNDASPDDWRGRIIAIFYMGYVLSIGFGSYLLTFVSLDGTEAPLIAILFLTLSILPIVLTRLHSPAPPENVALALRRVWKISPVGLVGLFVVGGMTMLVQGFTPIFATAEGYSKNDVALLMMLMQLGMVAVQYPLGALSDRIDRRIVLVIACVLVTVSALAVGIEIGTGLIWLILLFALWSGATESIYAVATAHANDRADPQAYVAVSSTLLIAWSVSGFAIPGIATLLTEFSGPRSFVFVSIGVAVLYGAFVIFRMMQREPVEEDQTEPFQPMAAQVPHTAELAPLPVEDDQIDPSPPD